MGKDIRSEVANFAPTLCRVVHALAGEWLSVVKDRLDAGSLPTLPKTINDAVWGTIELWPCEVLLLDSPLLQRLRGVRQLGMAHLVYPGAGYDRLEHSIGVVEAASRIMGSLARNARNRRRFGGKPDAATPEPSERDTTSVRLGALLHDIGHTPFSHATEHLIPRGFDTEYDAISKLLRNEFDGVTSIDPAELMAVLVVLSPAMTEILGHSKFNVHCERHELGEAIAARILGSRSFLDATYLSGVVSGSLDADKIDYMARDSHHAGLPLGLDLTRLVSQLEVVTVTPENAPNPELRKRAQQHEERRFFEVGISRAGLGAYEQFVIARVSLYERLYYHHKVRAAEGMVRSLVDALAQEAAPLSLDQLYRSFSDDTMVDIWGGVVVADGIPSGKTEARRVAERIDRRQLHHRAFAFSSRFIANLGNLSPQDQSLS